MGLFINQLFNASKDEKARIEQYMNNYVEAKSSLWL